MKLTAVSDITILLPNMDRRQTFPHLHVIRLSWCTREGFVRFPLGNRLAEVAFSRLASSLHVAPSRIRPLQGDFLSRSLRVWGNVLQV